MKTKMEKLHDFLTKKYLEWQAGIGERKTLEDFAIFLGVSRPLLSFWMNGKRKPNEENIYNISLKLGDEIYDILQLPRPDKNIIYIQTHAQNLDPQKARAVREIIEKYIVQNEHKI